MIQSVRVAILAVLTVLALSPSVTAGKKTFVYIHDRGAVDQVFGFQLSKAGKLKPLKGSPFAGSDAGGLCGGPCQTLAWSSKRKALVSGGPSGLTVYTVPKSGKLKLVAGSPFGIGSSGQLGTAAVKKGSAVYVYSAEYALDQLRAYKWKSDRTLVEPTSSPIPVGDGPNGVRAQDDHLLLTNENDLTISSCKATSDGTLTPPQLSTSGTAFASTSSLSDDRAFAYQADFDGNIRVFGVDPDTGALTGLVGNPFDSTLSDASGGLTVGGSFLFAFAYLAANNNIAVMARLPDGSPDIATVYASGLTGVSAHCLARNDKFLIVASDMDDLLISFAVDPETGALTEVDSAALPNADRINDVISLKR